MSSSAKNFVMMECVSTVGDTYSSDEEKNDETEEIQLFSKELSVQFAAICEEVEISDQEFQLLTDLTKRVRKIAEGPNPRGQIATIIFRHNYLKLRNAGSNQLLMYLTELLQCRLFPLDWKHVDIEKIFQGSEFKVLPQERLLDVEAGFPCMDTESGRLVGVVTHSDHQAEVLACQLAKHLLKYDPRAKSLLTLVHYWARVNDVTLSTPPPQILRSNVTNLPDPAALEWLCIFFLGHSITNIIPTLQKLRNRVKNRKNLVTEGWPETNLSFSYDLPFEKEWKLAKKKADSIPPEGSNEYVLKMLQLAHHFFSFCSSKKLIGQVLNTVDASVVPVATAIEKGLIVPSPCVKECFDKQSMELITKKALALELEREVYLMQPFNNHRFDFCQTKFATQIRPFMEQTAKKLELYLKKRKNDVDFEIDLKSLFKCGEAIVHHGIHVKKLPFVLVLPSTLPRKNEPKPDECYEKKPEIQPLVNPGSPEVSHLLAVNFAAIRAEVEIPEEEFQVINDLLGRIQDEVKKTIQDVHTTLFRHHYLQLRNEGSNHILIYLALPSYQPIFMGRQQVEELFQGSNLKYLRFSKSKAEIGMPFLDQESRLQFELETHSAQHAEVVTCQLAKHLLKFDPRARSLLTLVHYWARQNGVTLSKTGFIPMQEQEHNIPDPTALEWLCFFYLTYEKVIPSLNMLKRKRSTNPDAHIEGNERLKTDFFIDPEFVQEWRKKKLNNMPVEGTNEYVLNVLQLAHGFFRFCSGNKLKGKLLKTNCGEIIALSDAIKEGFFSSSIDTDGNPFGGQLPHSDEICLLQPFKKRRFAICQQKFDTFVRPRMMETAIKLQAYLEKERNSMDGVVLEIDLKSLFKCGMKMEIIYSKPRDNVDQQEESDVMDGKEEELPESFQNNQNESFKRTSGGADLNSLSKYFQTLRLEVEVPENEWESLTDFQQKLMGFFASHGFPKSQLVLFRNRYMKLQPVDSETSTIFFLLHPDLHAVDDESSSLQDSSNLGRTRTVREKLIEGIETNDEYSDETKRRLLSTIEQSPAPVVGTQLDMPLLSFKKHKFCVASPWFLPEVQSCRMVDYYCTFDPRVKPLITVVYYWAKLNNIRLGKEKDGPRMFTVGEAPDPALLEWLVVFFLCQMKILPPPCEMLGRNASAEAELFFDGINIGFKADPEYAREWWNRYKETDEEYLIHDVFMLAREFFQFWSEFCFKAMVHPVVIDLKGGNYFEKQVINENLNNERRLSWETGISLQDLELLNSEPMISEGFYSWDEVVTILHPVYIKHRFSFCWESFLLSVCSKMSVMQKELRKMLKAYSTDGDFDVGSLQWKP